MCSRYCIERNDANYVCDPRGEKVCLVGWTGKDCDIATKNVFPTPSEETDPPRSSVSTTLPSTGRLLSQKHEPAVMRSTTSAGVTSFSASTTLPNSATTTELFIPKVSHLIPRFTTIRVTDRTRARSVSSSTRQAPASTVSSQSGNIEVLKIVSPSDDDNSTSSCIETVITVFLVLITSALLGYLLTMCVRNSSVQNWINDRKAGIFAPRRCPSSRKYNSQEPLKEVSDKTGLASLLPFAFAYFLFG
ncbi:hypothetical protein ANCCAN_19453 [Ancylostoma caninum]|uniref:Delta-like protein n=1 Tax=Ancylostoma caninum TaxID=29170 RepID=A0A368FRJ8_ANCCA|nr:hypothetical protein ANCCAN_19453 [Ancylostoma caninum]